MKKLNWYQLGIKEVFENFHTSEHGLGKEEVEKRLRHYGPNKLIEEEKISKLQILLHQFTSPLIYVLLIAALLSIIIHEWSDAAFIAAVLMINGIIGSTPLIFGKAQ